MYDQSLVRPRVLCSIVQHLDMLMGDSAFGRRQPKREVRSDEDRDLAQMNPRPNEHHLNAVLPPTIGSAGLTPDGLSYVSTFTCKVTGPTFLQDTYLSNSRNSLTFASNEEATDMATAVKPH